MALTKSKLSIPFTQGLETKSDDQQLQLGGFRQLENVIFDSPNRLLKRNGYSILKTEKIDDTSINGAQYLAGFSDELGLMTNTDYYGYSPSINKWSSKGKVYSATPSSEQIFRNNLQQKNVDTVLREGIAAYTYEDSEGVKLSVVDTVNDNFLVNGQILSASGTLPTISNIRNKIYVFYKDSTDIKFRTFNILDPSTVTAETTAISDLDGTNSKYDTTSGDSKIIMAYNSSDAGGTLKVLSVLEDDTTSSVTAIAGEVPSDALDVYVDPNFRIVITYSNGSEVKLISFSFTFSAQLIATTTIESISDVVNCTSIMSSSGEYTVFYEVSASSVKNHLIRKNTISTAASVGTASEVIRSVGLASKAFQVSNIDYITAVHDSPLQSTYFVLDSDGEIISRFSPNTAGGLITENGLPNSPSFSSTKILVPSLLKGRIISDDDTFFTSLGVNSTILDFNLENPYQNEREGQNLHIAGGILKMYDGSSIVEHSFFLFPEDLTTGSTSTVGGNMSDGQYQYVAVYKWTDNKGFVHQSAPSIPLSVTLTGGTATQQQSIVIPTLRLTQKTNVVVDLYRTEAAGTIFYKVTSTLSPNLNDPTADTITITDDIADTSLIDNELLYTTGGLLENIAAPSSSLVESFGGRIFLAGLEDGNKLQYSKIRFEGLPVEFNDVLTAQVSSKGGNITALKAMDEKLIIFKRTAIFYISGDGPNNLGQQDTFTSPELVTSDIGCINPNSVVLTPLGLMFKSNKGIYLLGRNLSLNYVGAPVEEFNDLEVTSAIVVSEDNQVRFTTRTGNALVYNYRTNTWASFDNHAGVSAVTVDDVYYYLRSDGVLYQENNRSFTDNGSPIQIKLRTGWISFAGVQGFQRVYKFLLLGEFKSPHKLRIRIAYDFNESFVQEAIIDTADFLDNTRYGDYSPYGSPESIPYGGDGNVHQLRVDLKRQKCQAIKIQIEELQTDFDNLGEGLSLSNAMFEIGEKRGVNKIPATKQYGTE